MFEEASLARLFKKQDDAALGWRVDEVKRLKVKTGEIYSREIEVEVMREPTIGFNPKRMTTTLRFTIDVADCPSFGEGGITLYEGNTLFGVEKAWKWIEGWAKDDLLTFFLQD